MPFAGIDIGAATAKAVILGEDGRLQHYVMPTGYSVKKAVTEVMGAVLAKAGMCLEDMNYVVSTGYGRNAVDFTCKVSSEIICHAKGAHALIPATRTIVDIGGQDSKVIEVNGEGRVMDFKMNDKCAAGTGRFLEVMAGVLRLDLEDLGPVSLKSNQPCQITSTCTVFAETEVISLRAEGRSRENILAGIHRAIAHRTKLMATSISMRTEVVFTGGVAKNVGMRKALEDLMGYEIVVPDEPQIMGALGAALLAKESYLTQDN